MTPRLPYGRGWACKRQQAGSAPAAVRTFLLPSQHAREQACSCSSRLCGMLSERLCDAAGPHLGKDELQQ